jgi:hypothetical protein
MCRDEAPVPCGGRSNGKIRRFEGVPQGVGWDGTGAPSIRVEQAVKFIDATATFEVIDHGCDYGGMFS